jgi:hypothetical protein
MNHRDASKSASDRLNRVGPHAVHMLKAVEGKLYEALRQLLPKLKLNPFRSKPLCYLHICTAYHDTYSFFSACLTAHKSICL